MRFSHNAIENRVYYDLATTLYYFSNKRKGNELTGQSYRRSQGWGRRGGQEKI